MNVPDEQLAELVKAAQDAETAWLDTHRSRTGNWSRVTDSQAARYIAAALEQLPAENADQRSAIEREVRREIAVQAREAAGQMRLQTSADMRSDAATLEWFAEMITAGDSDA